MHDERRKVYVNLRFLSWPFKKYASHMLLLPGFEFLQSALVVQWRSMTNQLMYTLLGSNPKGQLNASTDRRHHQDCAKSIVEGVEKIKAEVGNRSVVLFSDIHTGCEQGGKVCGYREFESLWRKHLDLDADRKAAQAYLEGHHHWSSGDAIVSRYMQEHPFHKGYESDGGVEGLLIEYLSGHAFALLTCTNEDCWHCARWDSGFSRSIVAVRMQSQTTKCMTWDSWTSPRLPVGCPPRHQQER